MIRKLDDLGRITIPKWIREILKFDDNQTLFITLEDDKIVIQKHED